MLAIFGLLVLLPVSQRADPSQLFKGGGKQAPGKYLLDRRSLPIIAHEEFIPRVIMTQSGDQVLDFGQNLAGWNSRTACPQRDERLGWTGDAAIC